MKKSKIFIVGLIVLLFVSGLIVGCEENHCWDPSQSNNCNTEGGCKGDCGGGTKCTC